jgi:PAS domain S-box-containing protein
MKIAEGFPTTILVVDDKQHVRDSLASVIRLASPLYQVAAAASGSEAIERLRQAPVDVVLCDLVLSGELGGIEVTREIRRLHPATRVIVFTGVDSSSDTKVQALQAGAFSYLSKPINHDELLLGIRSINSIRSTEYLGRCFETLARIAYSLQETFRESLLAERVVEGAQDLGFHRARLYLFDDKSQMLIGRAIRGKVNLDRDFVGYTIPLASSPIINTIFDYDRPTVWNKEDIVAQFGPQSLEPWIDEMDLRDIPWIDAPLVVGKRHIGTLALDYRYAPHRLYTQEDLRIAGIFAGLAAHALNNARLYQEQALAHASLSSILREAPDAVISTDLHGVVKLASPSVEWVTGHSPEGMVGRHASEFYTDERGTVVGKEVALDLMREVRQRGRVGNRKVCVLGSDGRPRPVSVSISLLHDEQKQEIGTLGILKDLGPYEAQTRRYRDLLEGFGYGTILLDTDGTVEFCNGKAERLLHRASGGALGLRFSSLISEHQREEFGQSFVAVLTEGMQRGLDLELLRPDGLPVPVKGFLTPFRSEGVIKGVTVALYGVTELASLDQSGRLMALGQMAATLPHEINNALNHVLPAARDLEAQLTKEGAVSKRVRFYLDMIQRNAERIGKIVGIIREFARPGLFRFEPVGLQKVVEEAVELVRTGLRKSGIAVELELPADLPDVLGEPTRLLQVFVNLLTNAREAMEAQTEPREIRIQARFQPPDRVVVRVCDTGPGIPEEVVESLFDPFFTLKPGRGTGLGLFLVKSILELHEGTVDLVDRPGERGTCFQLELKAANPI